MADKKEFPLSIVIRTIDQATAGIKKVHDGIHHQIEKIHGPTNRLGASLSALGKAAGLPHLAEKFHHVGHAAHHAWEEVGELKEKFFEFAIGIGIGALEVEHLIHQFADLAKTAKLIGITVDSLAQFRFAAEQSGVSAEEFDGAIEKFNKNLGQMKTGGGQFLQFLNKVSPALARQIKGAKSNEEAFDLLSDAMKKVKDPTKLALIATQAFGRAGQPLINMMRGGSKAIEEHKKEYLELAGSQEEAAETALHVHHAMGRVSAAADGIKAAIVVGLGPSLEHLADLLKEFLVEHRAEIAAFIKDFGEKLPGRIHDLVHAFETAIGIIAPVWSMIGGLKGAAIILAAVITGKLIVALVELGIALLTTPIGLVIAAVGALIAIGILLVKNWDYVKGFFVECWNVIKGAFSDAWDFIKGIVDKIVGAVDTVKKALDAISGGAGGKQEVFGGISDVGFGGTRQLLGVQSPGAVAAGGPKTLGEARIQVDFANAPKGTRISADPKSTADVDLSVGYQMGLP